MTKASDNIFPKVTFVEGSAPSSPAATDFHLYFDSSDHILKWKNSAGTVFPVTTGGFANPMTTAEDIIYGGASGAPTRKAVGSNGTFLGVTTGAIGYTAVTDALLSTSDITTNNASTTKHGFAPKYPNDATKYLDGTGAYTVPAGGGGTGSLVFLEAHTASASATLDFTTFISATYDTYLFQLVRMVPATNHVSLVMRMGTGGGPTYDAGTNYSYDSLVMRAGGTGVGGGSGQTELSLVFSAGDSIENGTASLDSVSGFCTLYDPSNTTTAKQVEGDVTYRDAVPFRVRNLFRGGYESTTAVTAVRFLMSSGNITSGVIRVYGYTKS